MNATCAGYSGSAAASSAVRQGGPQAVRASLVQVREATLDMARRYEAALGPGLQVPSHPWLNPPRWELGHVAWFQQAWTVRNPQRARGARCDPQVARRPSDLPQADAWYDSSAVAHALRWQLPLPPLSATLGWLSDTQARTLELLDALPACADDDALYFFRLACLHEAMHVEAARYMARMLGIAWGPPLDPLAFRGGPAGITIPARTCQLGCSEAGFAFDNELQPHPVDLQAFEIDAAPVSWRRFGEFVADGGFAQPRWWSPQGWAWRLAQRPARPEFPGGDDAAVHLSAHEADAWCRWAGRRLPSEAEWECAALTEPRFAWGRVWEWTSSRFQPYPGFAPHPYRDYSLPWFGSRRVLRGASVATPACLAHPRFRNFFPPERTDIFAGFRSCA